MKMKKILLFAASALLFAACSGGGRPTFGDNEYPVTEVKASSAAMKQTYPASIKGVQDVQISPKIGGFLTKIYVNEGQTVSAGQVLFEIDNQTYQAQVRQAQASVTTAQAAVNTAKLTYENSKKLFDNRVIGDYEMQTSQNSYEQAKAALAQAEAALANAKEALSFCFVKSPASGVVGTLPFKVGALVSAQNVLTTVSDNSSMEVYFSMNEKDVLAMSKSEGGQKAALAALPAVKLQLADGSIYASEGKVAKMSGVIDQSTGTVQMIAVFPNPDKLLKSGGSGVVIIPRDQDTAIVIPQSCVSEVQNKKFVYTLGKDNKVVYTEITVDPQNDGNNYVVTSGLKIGDKYVTNGITKLTDQMEIVPITPERYQEKIQEQAKAMTAGDIVGEMKK
ncbi:MAG: efflux RND transporter periplasmic adaptor subunit [Prevotella sp.]|jgi:membrane fusion protein (multidrug efflux system)|uniref:efflux RND transporter periplasmic adaptor subunit n=1 Tax=Prevotella sp. E13-27 TaxID=2938122 RepID=UPI00200A367E|nr:efflux RND transporter periplasmic adaptor subunit [Prevotella sp. E13-27]MBR4565766.1 efflux RND transporter periplasmic adaptor subunit [Prevotella sp.]MCK8621952.1 efflux RND transporter periplasmic adaptor subunit [Prevotella sp. E13-27]